MMAGACAVNAILVTAQFPHPPRLGMTMRVYQLNRQRDRRHNVPLLSAPSPPQCDAVRELRDELPVVVIERLYNRVAGGIAEPTSALVAVAGTPR
jgi:hypothetical protein